MSNENVPDSDDSSTSDILDLRNEEGWEDVEDDKIDETFVSLFDEKSFSDVTEMLTYCKNSFDFDIWRIQREHGLDFLELVKLVNFVRRQVKQGDKLPEFKSKAIFDDEIYLLPVMEDDAVLYSLEDVIQRSSSPASHEVDELREQLQSLQSQFAAYRDEVQKYLDPDLKEIGKESSKLPPVKGPWSHTEQEDHYFNSYSYNSIHESMLKDTVRTDAYRDFIYENKDLFKDRIVLDVGCGTGILSMFCARAGAKLVIAVDNSDIVEKAKQNIKANNLEDKIHCVRGKIEEVPLPVEQVDIIVSEWMGYCLLFESMLDSVIHARDKYLAPDGLMVPSHVTIQLAPLSDSDLRVSYIDFWKDVYGFDMTSMLEKAEEEVLIRVVDSKDIASPTPATVLLLDLHTAQVKDLDFTGDFRLEASNGSELLEGFVLWFDTYFLRSRAENLSTSGQVVAAAKSKGITAFSTGPATQSTHWQQGVCLINEPIDKLTSGATIEGKVTYRKRAKARRALEIDISWEVATSGRKSQTWYLE